MNDPAPFDTDDERDAAAHEHLVAHERRAGHAPAAYLRLVPTPEELELEASVRERRERRAMQREFPRPWYESNAAIAAAFLLAAGAFGLLLSAWLYP